MCCARPWDTNLSKILMLCPLEAFTAGMPRGGGPVCVEKKGGCLEAETGR